MTDQHCLDHWYRISPQHQAATTVDRWLTRKESARLFEHLQADYDKDDPPVFGLQRVLLIAYHIEQRALAAQGNLAHWMLDGILTVAGYQFSGPEITQPNLTFDDVRELLEESIRKDVEDGDFWWKEDDKAAARAWVQQTPFEIFSLVIALEEKTQAVVRENLLDMGREKSDGGAVARFVSAEWERAGKKWRKNWEKARSQLDGSRVVTATETRE